MTTFFIFGSCVSQETLLLPLPGITLLGMIDRTAIRSILASPLSVTMFQYREKANEFGMHCARTDLEKRFFSVLRQRKADYLIVDLFSETLPIVPWEGSCLTGSDFLKQCMVREERGRLIPETLNEQQIIDATISQIPAFMDQLKLFYPLERVILHEIRGSSIMRETDGTLALYGEPHALSEIQRENDRLCIYH